MSELTDEGLAAILGLVIKTVGEVKIPHSSVEEGLPENAGVRVEYNEKTDMLTVKIVTVGE